VNSRLRKIAVNASRGNALTGLVIGWAIGKHISSPWGITTVIFLALVYGYGIHKILKEEKFYEDYLGEFTNSSETGDNSG
jgi:F0F1-type ATP synthase assembly protein I